MNSNTLIIPIAFVLLTALLLWFIIGARGKVWVKLISIVVVPGMMVLVWLSLDSYKGWPTANQPGCPMLFLWGEVQEPDSKTGDNGSAYLWLRPLTPRERGFTDALDYVQDKFEPRAYRLAYSRDLHKALDTVKPLVSEGQKIVLECPKDQTSGKPGSGTRHGYGSFSKSKQKFIFYKLPPPKLPEKKH